MVDVQSGEILAGTRAVNGSGFADSAQLTRDRLAQNQEQLSGAPLANTTIAVVATNVALTKSGCTKVAQMAHDGMARAIRPIHTASDGDTIFALSLGDKAGPTTARRIANASHSASAVGTVAADVLAEAINRAVHQAESLHGIPARRDL